MKYTFDKFKIQFVPKARQSPQVKKKSSFSYSNNQAEKRKIKTAQIKYHRPHNTPQNIEQDSFNFKKSEDYLGGAFIADNENMSRSLSLQQNVCVIKQKGKKYQDWLKYSTSNNKQRQQQYRAFEQKCIDLLSKKKIQNDKMNDKFPKDGSLNNSQLNPRKFINLNKPHTVHDMMNNIIQRFKNDTRIKHDSTSMQQHQSPTLKKNVKQTFRSRRSSNPNHTNRQTDLTDQEQTEIFQMIKSTQLRRNQSVTTNDRKNKKQKRQNQQQISDAEERYLHSNLMDVNKLKWKDLPEVNGIKINKKLLTKDPMQRVNPIVCVSMSLTEQSSITRKLQPFPNHVGLSPAKPSKRKKIQLNRPHNKLRFMRFSKNSDEQYSKKIKSFLDFLFKINFSNNIYVSLQLASLQQSINHHKYKVFVGNGNNGLLIKSLLRRRQWLQIVDNINQEGIQFYWTQNKVQEVHNRQLKCQGFKGTRAAMSTHQRKKSYRNLAELQQMNQKILSKDKSQNVEDYIFKDGYQIPFQNEYKPNILTNHLPGNYVIGSKKNLFKSLLAYYTNVTNQDPFQFIPKTYHIKSIDDIQYKQFVKQNSNEPNKIWIVKPGENSNRGNGIKLSKFNKIQSLIKEKRIHNNGHLQTYIVQSYINKPFLYNGRKFDVRHFILATSVNGILKIYWYRDGYLRTSSQHYDLDDVQNDFVHLTNDAIQQKSQDYGKYQQANKLSYTQFQRYLDYNYTNKGYNFENTLKSMRQVITDVVKATYLNLDKDRRQDNFQIFGFDFMLNKEFKPYLIQINFNPCLIMNCNLLNRIIPPLIENSFRLGLDPLLTPKCHLPVNKRLNLTQNYLKNLRYQLIFDEATLKKDIYNKIDLQDSEDQQQQFCDNGKQLPQNFTF